MSHRMRQEAAIHMRLRHANIVSMIGVVFDVENHGFVLEHVKFGSYYTFLKNIPSKDGQGLFINFVPLSMAFSPFALKGE